MDVHMMADGKLHSIAMAMGGDCPHRFMILQSGDAKVAPVN